MEVIGPIIAAFVWLLTRTFAFAFLLWFDAYYPEVATRIRTTYVERGRRSVFIGVFNLIAWFLVAVLLLQTPLGVFGLAVLAALIGAATIGFAPAYRELGNRLTGGEERSAFRNLVYGFVCLEAACLTPLIGQILFFGVLVRGLGAVIATMLASRRGARDEAPPIPVQSTDSGTSSNANAIT